jgi:hypothetical protein
MYGPNPNSNDYHLDLLYVDVAELDEHIIESIAYYCAILRSTDQIPK